MDYNKICPVCDHEFKFYDEVHCFNDVIYHHDCVELYPIEYCVYVGTEFLGRTENESGEDYYDYIEFADEEWE